MRKSRDHSERRCTGRDLARFLLFDYLYVGDSGPLGKYGLYERDRFKYILVIMDDLKNFV